MILKVMKMRKTQKYNTVTMRETHTVPLLQQITCHLIFPGSFSLFSIQRADFACGFAADLTFNKPVLAMYFLAHLLDSMLEVHNSFVNQNI